MNGISCFGSAVRLIGLATGADEARSQAAFEACGGQVKTAIVAVLKALGPDQARERLAAGPVQAAPDAMPRPYRPINLADYL